MQIVFTLGVSGFVSKGGGMQILQIVFTLGVSRFVSEGGGIYIRVGPRLLLPGCEVGVKSHPSEMEEGGDQKHRLPFVSGLDEEEREEEEEQKDKD